MSVIPLLLAVAFAQGTADTPTTTVTVEEGNATVNTGWDNPTIVVGAVVGGLTTLLGMLTTLGVIRPGIRKDMKDAPLTDVEGELLRSTAHNVGLLIGKVDHTHKCFERRTAALEQQISDARKERQDGFTVLEKQIARTTRIVERQTPILQAIADQIDLKVAVPTLSDDDTEPGKGNA